MLRVLINVKSKKNFVLWGFEDLPFVYGYLKDQIAVNTTRLLSINCLLFFIILLFAVKKKKNMDMPLRLKRPKPGDGDKEIALMQEEFNVINLQAQKRHKNNEPCSVPGTGMAKEGKIRSKFAESRAFKQQQASESGGQMINPAILDRMKVKEADKKVPDFVQNVPMNPSTIILGNVVEKKVITKLTHEVQPKSTVEKKPTGFPEVFVVDHKVVAIYYLLIFV